ncbi:response regulator [Limisphaera sp. VF-2]|uniref:response regulator n=1 Tax=Limisphaera sp. VF-2 TaxID=3400418 RepID=UPI00256671BD|nr:response regulator [Limisphaera sp.]
MAQKAPTVLVIEDDDYQYELYEETLEGYQLVRVRTGSEALASLPRVQPDVLILDHVLEKGELGLDFLPEFKELLPHVPIIIVSGALEVHEQLRALQGPRRAHYCLPKPVDLRQLRRTVEEALRECGPQEVVRQFEALERSQRIDAVELLSRSTDRLSRQNQILARLRGQRQRANISALAREFKVARRTIIRDLQELIRRGQLPEEVYPEWRKPGEPGD